MADRYYSWDAYIDLNERLVVKVAESGWQFDSILCLSRGGMRPGDFFSRVYDMPLAILATSSYREKAGTVQSDLDIAECITGVSELSGKVLLVDDMVDSGKTIREVVRHLKERYPAITEIRVAVLWYKAHSVLVPDWYGEAHRTRPRQAPRSLIGLCPPDFQTRARGKRVSGFSLFVSPALLGRPTSEATP